jgi:hypothetical protein
MNNLKCKKCDTTEVEYINKKTKALASTGIPFQIGAYCKKCGAFIKWAEQTPDIISIAKKSKDLF